MRAAYRVACNVHGRRTFSGIYRLLSQVDLPRTHPTVRLFRLEAVQRVLERILNIWAIRHPASGYVQGINDLVTPFMCATVSTRTPAPARLHPHACTRTPAHARLHTHACTRTHALDVRGGCVAVGAAQLRSVVRSGA